MSNNIWIVKIGSSLLTGNGTQINTTLIKKLTEQIAAIQQHHTRIILVSSGAIASGMKIVELSEKPTDIHQLQALASIGQMELMHTYEKEFLNQNITSSQVLLTHENLTNQERYNNIFGTLNILLDWNVVPIVNENDTVSTAEIKFGDNDNLAALLGNLISAEKLIILTDQDGVFDKNPTKHSDAILIKNIDKNDKNLDTSATSESGYVGTGGMFSKVLAARVFEGTTHIINGNQDNSLMQIMNNDNTGTILQ